MFNQASYEVGDTLVYNTFGGQRRVVVVEDKEEDIKNGRPGFHGVEATGSGCWGYDDQIVEVRRKPAVAGKS